MKNIIPRTLSQAGSESQIHFIVVHSKAGSDMQEKSEDTYNDAEVAPDEPSSSEHVVNMYQFSLTMEKMNIEK